MLIAQKNRVRIKVEPDNKQSLIKTGFVCVINYQSVNIKHKFNTLLLFLGKRHVNNTIKKIFNA